jgi:hypothetical protein
MCSNVSEELATTITEVEESICLGDGGNIFVWNVEYIYQILRCHIPQHGYIKKFGVWPPQ